MQDKIAVFRASASPQIGAGHITRCISLAEELTELGWKSVFASEPQTLETTPFLNEYDIITITNSDPESEASMLKDSIISTASLVIVDHYKRNKDFETNCRQWAKQIVAIDDMPTRQHDSDLLLDQSGGRREGDYKGLVPPNCKLLIGPKFSLLRKSFYLTAQEQRIPKTFLNKRIFLSMGAVDHHNLTSPILRALVEICPEFSVDVVLSQTAPHLNEVRTLCHSYKNFDLHIDTKDPANIMKHADFAVGTAGVNLWERCTLGIPSIIFIAAENQRSNANYVIENGGGLFGGEGEILAPEILGSAILDITKNIQTLSNFSLAASKICDGIGASRVAKRIVALNSW